MVCSECRQCMTTREERGDRIGRTRSYTYRRLICECAKCKGTVIIRIQDHAGLTEAVKQHQAWLRRVGKLNAKIPIRKRRRSAAISKAMRRVEARLLGAK